MIPITKTTASRLESLDFNNIPFGRVFSDHMFYAEYDNGEWQSMDIRPLENLSVHPANLAWHYGQSIFEGMKATKHQDGTPMLMRPEMHARRMNASAERMCMPQLPEEIFIEAVSKLVSLESDWIPPAKGSALYLRPIMFAADEFIGVKPSEKYIYIIMALPVGPYYSTPLKLKAESKYIRAADGGVGEAKTAGNYAASLYPWKLAKEEGYDQIMWLDSNERKYIQEVGTMNIWFVIDDTVITPKASGSILKGITRNSIITVLEDEGYKVEERDITIDEVMEAGSNGSLKEVFGSGTAAVVIHVKEIGYNGKTVSIDPETFKVAPFAKNYIDSLRDGSLTDKFGWITKLPETIKA